MSCRSLLPALLVLACSSEVTVGENHSPVPRLGDSGLLAVRYDAASDSVVAAGHHGCAEPSSVDCDVWLARVDEPPEGASVALWWSGLRDVASALWLLGGDARVLAGVASSSSLPRAAALRFDGESDTWVNEELSLAAESEATAIDAAPDGTLVIGGNELTDDGSLDGFAARIDEDGTVSMRSSLTGTGAARTEITSLAVSVRNQVFVGGVRSRGEGAELERLPVLVQLSSELEVFNSNTTLGLTVASGKTSGLFFDGDDEMLVCGSADDQAFVLRIDFLLSPIASNLVADPDGPIDVRGCAPTDDGGVVLVGAAGGAPWVGKFDRASLELSFTAKPGPAAASLWAVTGTSSGRAVAVGRNEPAGRPFALHIEP